MKFPLSGLLSADLSVKDMPVCPSGYHGVTVMWTFSCSTDAQVDTGKAPDEIGYLVSGPDGATLKKVGAGFELVKGQANYLKPGMNLQ